MEASLYQLFYDYQRRIEGSVSAILEKRAPTSLRDQFAMAALQGLLASYDSEAMAAIVADDVALAYTYADAMMAQRAKESV